LHPVAAPLRVGLIQALAVKQTSRRTMQKHILLSALVLLVTAGATLAKQPQAPASVIFDKYQSLEHSFDPALADLYCDGALIRNSRKYPNGQIRTIEIPAAKYKELIRAALPLAKASGDFSTYSHVSFEPEGSNVRVTATRYSVLKRYSSPMSLLVGSCGASGWGVLEEIGESQP
jgi:hypothetical protein